MRLVSGFITLVILLLALGFTVKNDGNVTLSFWPFDAGVTLPVALLIFGLLFTGFFLGSLLTWITTLSLRFEVRSLRKKIAALNKKLETVNPVILPPWRDEISSTPAPSNPLRKYLWFGQ